METTLSRGAGILLPISSLPSPYGIGTLGKEAYRFVDFLQSAHQKFWQVLPVAPTSYGDSPYQGFSAFAGNPYFIDLDLLVDEGLLDIAEVRNKNWYYHPAYIEYGTQFNERFPLLRKAFANSIHKENAEYEMFCQKNEYWLNDYALFMACKVYFNHAGWSDWEEDIRFRKPEAVEKYASLLKEDIEFWKFVQFKFFEQWSALRAYANNAGISIIGDIPIYVAFDSADVWTHPDIFQLDENLTPIKVAGVPPDAFSDDGQLWGNPLYDWEKIEKGGFDWWRNRIAASANLYNVIRFDHFIGVSQYYTIPYGSKDGKTGEWKKGPGQKLIDVMMEAAGETKIIAEDLGVAVPEVKELLAKNHLPGMKIIEFAFGGGADNEHMPHNYIPNYVVYGGTHDNDTLAGYFSSCQWWEKDYACDYMGVRDKNSIQEIIDAVFRTAYGSVASVVLFQAQDLLGLGSEARMNMPSSMGNNWKWRLLPGQLGEKEAEKLRHLCRVYGR